MNFLFWKHVNEVIIIKLWKIRDVQKLLPRRDNEEEFKILFQELRDQLEKFLEYFRMRPAAFVIHLGENTRQNQKVFRIRGSNNMCNCKINNQNKSKLIIQFTSKQTQFARKNQTCLNGQLILTTSCMFLRNRRYQCLHSQWQTRVCLGKFVRTRIHCNRNPKPLNTCASWTLIFLRYSLVFAIQIYSVLSCMFFLFNHIFT